MLLGENTVDDAEPETVVTPYVSIVNIKNISLQPYQNKSGSKSPTEENTISQQLLSATSKSD